MKVGKPKSKRVPVRLRHKIEKASTAKQRKQRKEAKKNPQWRSRLKKDPGIPNLFPYKAKILAEIEESKRRNEEEKMQKREQAKARREGRAVEETADAVDIQPESDAELMDDEEEEDAGSPELGADEQMADDGANPMAALLASAQARAQAYGKGNIQEAADGEDDDEAWGGLEDENETAPSAQAKKTLPQQALADPIKAISLLMERMEKTPNGIQVLLDHYQIPPLVTAGSDLATRFLVEVARKRGRLGKGGVPNVHAAALIVLGDLNDEKLTLPSVEESKPSKTTRKGAVTIVKSMAAPFRIEGLWQDKAGHGEVTEMAVDS